MRGGAAERILRDPTKLQFMPFSPQLGGHEMIRRNFLVAVFLCWALSALP